MTARTLGRDADGDTVVGIDSPYLGLVVWILTPCCAAGERAGRCDACRSIVAPKYGQVAVVEPGEPTPFVVDGARHRKPEPDRIARSFARLIGRPRLARAIEQDIAACCRCWPDAMSVVPFVLNDGIAYEVIRYRAGIFVVDAESLALTVEGAVGAGVTA